VNRVPISQFKTEILHNYACALIKGLLEFTRSCHMHLAIEVSIIVEKWGEVFKIHAFLWYKDQLKTVPIGLHEGQYNWISTRSLIVLYLRSSCQAHLNKVQQDQFKHIFWFVRGTEE